MSQGISWFQWVSVVEIPVIILLAGALMKQRRDLSEDNNKTKAALAAYKVEVAEKYATVGYLKDVETRIINHLDRLEEKVDKLRS